MYINYSYDELVMYNNKDYKIHFIFNQVKYLKYEKHFFNR